ncbi:MAG TPA: hypothetical protein VGB55_09940, partial [Tepidisphaeraceae bacterium]
MRIVIPQRSVGILPTFLSIQNQTRRHEDTKKSNKKRNEEWAPSKTLLFFVSSCLRVFVSSRLNFFLKVGKMPTL